MHRSLTALLALLALAVAAPAPASAAGRDEIIKDCSDDGQLQGKYSASELRDARKNLPSDIAEYTDCADVLRRAELPDSKGSAGGGGGGSAGGGGVLPGGGSGTGSAGGGTVDAPREVLVPASEEERKSLSEASSRGAEPVEVNGQRVTPGAAGFAPNAARNDMPTNLLIAIAALALLGSAALGYALRGRFSPPGGMGGRMPADPRV
jgi:hypothetical protein